MYQVTMSALLEWFNTPEQKPAEFMSKFALPDGTPMKLSNLKDLIAQAGLVWEDRPKVQKPVKVKFTLVNDLETPEVIEPEDLEIEEFLTIGEVEVTQFN